MKFIIAALLFFSTIHANQKLDTLYHSLDRTSIAELFAFYHLYPESSSGQKALSDAWKLMNLHRIDQACLEENLVLPAMDLEGIISLVNKQSFEPSIVLSEDQLDAIETVSSHLKNRKLKGSSIWTRRDLLSLPIEEIDLARALLIYQYENEENGTIQIRQYEASLDLMTLQILARLKKEATNEEKIRAINRFIFHEKRFRFPPHSLWGKDIDVYTFLPSVLDSRQGVCLGVSILYLSIAQRLDLPLDIITPPGHIYLSYPSPDGEINIETTARGISPPSKSYLGINTRSLQKRNIKEVVGLALVNQASVALHRNDHKAAVELYEQAQPFLRDDQLLKMLLGFNYLFTGQKMKGKSLLKEIENKPFDHAVSCETAPEDYLKGKVNIEGLKTIFMSVDETRESILEKQASLKKILARYPLFRDGILHLAITQLQLAQTSDAVKTLSRYHELDPTNPTVEYYLSLVLMDRLKYKKAWEHLQNAEQITAAVDHHPDGLKGLRHHLRTLYPDPKDQLKPIP